jgi:hypothetical protein
VSEFLVLLAGGLIGSMAVSGLLIAREYRRAIVRRRLQPTRLGEVERGGVEREEHPERLGDLRTGEIQSWPAEPQRPNLSLTALEESLRRIGIEKYDLEAERQRISFGVVVGDVTAVFRMRIDESWNGISITSTETQLDKERLTIELAARLLELNSENKIGAIGVQELEDSGQYRIWVDQYMPVDGLAPTPDALRTTLGAVMAVHSEVRSALAMLSPQAA